MTHNGCAEFFQQIKSHFDYLFHEYDFSVVHKTGNGAHCLIVLQSGDCQIQFFYDRGIVEISAGTSQELYNIMWVINFVRGVPQPTPKELEGMMELFWSMGIDEGLANFSKILRPVCAEIVKLFQENSFARRRNEFEQFYYS